MGEIAGNAHVFTAALSNNPRHALLHSGSAVQAAMAAQAMSNATASQN
jgi:hypothetical protein